MDNICGNKAVTGGNYYGREKIIKRLVAFLLSGNSFLLLGLRRIGKSSTVAETIRQIKERNSKVKIIELNCQTYKSIDDFYKHLHLALPLSWQESLAEALRKSGRIPKKVIDFVTDHIEEVDIPLIGSVKLRNDIIAYSNPIREEITKFFESKDEHIILAIDELPFLFESIDQSDNPSKVLEIESILTTLRDWRNIGISQAICGSLNLHLQLQQMGISRKLLAGLTSQQLAKFSEEEASGLLEALADSHNPISLSADEIATMIDILPDNIPQFLQYYFFIVNTYYEGNEHELKQLYDEHVYPVIVQDFEYQFEERYAQFTEEQRDVSKIIFDLVIKEDQHQSYLLEQIESESGYIVLLKLLDNEFLAMDSNQNYSFSFELVRNWWIKINL